MNAKKKQTLNCVYGWFRWPPFFFFYKVIWNEFVDFITSE